MQAGTDILGSPAPRPRVSYWLDTFRTDDLLFELVQRGSVPWRELLLAGGADPTDIETRELVELQIRDGLVVLVTEPGPS